MRSAISIRLSLAMAIFGASLTILESCRRVDTSNATGMATMPKDMFSTDTKKKCADRAAKLSISASQQTTLCERATSSEPVDCFNRKRGQGIAVDLAVTQCRTPDRPH